MKKANTLLLAFFTAFFLSGCFKYSGRYEAVNELRIPQQMPYKFRICNVKLPNLPESSSSSQQDYLKKQQESRIVIEDLKRNLLQKYPQFFTLDERNSLPLDLEVASTQKVESHADGWEISSVFLGLFTLGVVPMVLTNGDYYNITATSGTIKGQEEFCIVHKDVAGMGILGLFIPIWRLVPPIKNYHFQHTMEENLKAHVRFHNDSEDFLKLFLSAIAALDQKKLMEMHDKNDNTNFQFLE